MSVYKWVNKCYIYIYIYKHLIALLSDIKHLIKQFLLPGVPNKIIIMIIMLIVRMIIIVIITKVPRPIPRRERGSGCRHHMLQVYVYVCIHIYIYILCMYVYMYTYIYIYIYIRQALHHQHRDISQIDVAASEIKRTLPGFLMRLCAGNGTVSSLDFNSRSLKQHIYIYI